MNDEKYVRKVSNLKKCPLCEILDEEANNLIDILSSLESEIATLKQKLKDNQSSLIAVLADNEDLTKQLRIESEACELLNEQVKELVQKNKELVRKNRRYEEALEYYADEEHLNANYPMELAREALQDD